MKIIITHKIFYLCSKGVILMKMIVSDFDDTLYINKKIDKNLVKQIREFIKKGNIFVIATGSSYTSFKRKTKHSKLKYDYLIVNHGTSIFKNRKLIYNKILDKNIIDEIIKKYNLEDKNNYTLIKNTNGNFFSTARKGLVKPNTKKITKIHLEFNEEDYNNELKYLNNKYNNKINIYEINSNNDVEIINKNSSKLLAIEYIMLLENVLRKDIYTIGDGYSDIEMIKKYNGYAIKSGIEAVKKSAKKIVSSVMDLINDIDKY